MVSFCLASIAACAADATYFIIQVDNRISDHDAHICLEKIQEIAAQSCQSQLASENTISIISRRSRIVGAELNQQGVLKIEKLGCVKNIRLKCRSDRDLVAELQTKMAT